MKVEVRPIETVKWHGKKGKESFSRPKVIQALVSGSKNEYCTGLTPQEVEEYSKKIRVDLSPTFLGADKPHPFWDSKEAQVKLENHPQYFDDQVPLDFIKIHIMQASKFVANSMRAYNDGDFPYATHVIMDSKEEIEEKASKIALVNKAILDSSKLTHDRKAEIILIMSGKQMSKMSDEAISVELNELINKKPSEVSELINKDKKKVYLYAAILDALAKNILVRKGHKIFYFEVDLGFDEKEVLETLSKPDFEDIKLRIIEALEKK